MRPLDQTVVIQKRRYNTETATLIAGNDYWDGKNYERSGRNTFLFRTAKGNYFAQHRTAWSGEEDGRTEALTLDEAITLWDELREKRIEFEEAFPGQQVEEA